MGRECFSFCNSVCRTEKGKALEKLILGIFGEIKHTKATNDVKTQTNQFDCTVLCGVKTVFPSILNLLTPYFIVECKKAYERVIDFTILEGKAAEIFTAIKNREFDFQYMCESIAATGNYSSSRAIMILAEFEREYLNIFGQDYKRSQEYQITKRNLLDTMQTFIEQRQGRARKYARQFYHAIESHDVGFGERLRNAMVECQVIMEPFIKSKYAGALDVTIEEICDRMNTVRNGIAHSRLDLNLEAVHLSDLKIIEELLYAMRLQHLRVDTKSIQIGIKRLFGERISIE